MPEQRQRDVHVASLAHRRDQEPALLFGLVRIAHRQQRRVPFVDRARHVGGPLLHPVGPIARHQLVRRIEQRVGGLQHFHGCLLHRHPRRARRPLQRVRRESGKRIHVLRAVLHDQRATLVHVVQQACVVAYEDITRFVRARTDHDAREARQVRAGQHRRFDFFDSDVELLERFESRVADTLDIAHAGPHRQLHAHRRQVHAAATVQAHGRDVLVLNVVHAARAHGAVVQCQRHQLESTFLHHTAYAEGENRAAIGTHCAFAFYRVGLESFGQLQLHEHLGVVRIRRLNSHRHEAFHRNTGTNVLHRAAQIHRDAGHRRHRHLLIALDRIGEAIHHGLLHRHDLSCNGESHLYDGGTLLFLLRLRPRIDRRLKPVLLLATERPPPRRVGLECHRPAIQCRRTIGADRLITSFTRTQPKPRHRRVQQLHGGSSAVEHGYRDRQRIVHRNCHRLTHGIRGARRRCFHRHARCLHERAFHAIDRGHERVPESGRCLV